MTALSGDFQKALVAAVLETFENLAFMEPEFSPDKEFVAEVTFCCSLAIRTPLQCSIQIAMDEDLGKLITATIWSRQKDSVDEQMCRDALAELLNTIAGRFMKAVLPADQTFQLGLPEISEGCCAAGSDCKVFDFSLNGGMFRIALVVSES
ncbi:MAG: chemotaxis protein CheX [Desulfoprunum sp.]|nr:chemotaxis protein CheX [Desulfoprunum sp.]